MSASTPDQTALVVLVPEAEPLVSALRDAHDPSAAEGMPAHVTLVYPFAPADLVDREMEDDLAGLFAGMSAFPFVLGSAGSFPGVLYLEPEPAGPFQDLIRAAVAAFPDFPPYAGAYTDPVPHLTVGMEDCEDAMQVLASRLQARLERAGPISCRAGEVTLMRRLDRRWTAGRRFPLGKE